MSDKKARHVVGVLLHCRGVFIGVEVMVLFRPLTFFHTYLSKSLWTSCVGRVLAWVSSDERKSYFCRIHRHS